MHVSGLVRVVFMLLGAGLYWLLRLYFHVPFNVMVAGITAIVFVAVIGWPIGFFVGRYLSRDADVDTMAFKVIAGVNLVAWAVPVVGMALSTMTLQFSRRSNAMPVFFWVLAAIGGWGAIANAWIGGTHEMQLRENRRQALEIGGVVDSGERSTARCAYAGREVWSKADFEQYCRH
jgi:hypothetical protein